MKNLLKTIFLFVLTVGSTIQSSAQENSSSPLTLGQIAPYYMEVTYDKTSHLIFPSAIRYVDMGNECLIAGKVEHAENVLRVKAAVRDFESQTNFSVITDDGRFYNFDVLYSPSPEVMNYDLVKLQQSNDKHKTNNVLFEELGNTLPSLADQLMEYIYKKDKRIVKHIGSKSFGIQYLLKGIYIHNGKYYFHTELKNSSNVPFQIDFITFKVVDKKIAKRTVIQERTLTPLRIYKTQETLFGKATQQNVFLFDQFTIADDKKLVIEIFEINGGRQQIMEVENLDLVRARLIKDMHLKI